MIEIADYRIVRADPHNLAIEHKVTIAKAKNPFGRNGRPEDEAEAERVLKEWSEAPEKTEWKHVGWYGNIKQAAMRLVSILAEKEVVDGDEVKSVNDLLQTLSDIESRLTTLVDSYLKKEVVEVEE